MIKFTKRGIEINGIEQPFYSGSVHYWRLKRENWDIVLERIKGMGFSMIETYIPWSVHEYEEGNYDFGEIEDNKDIEAFLRLCEEKKVSVIVRPGPHINAEMTGFGYPEWILTDEEIQAKNPYGTTVVYPYVTKPFPIPSYASEKLYRKTEYYFKALEPILKRHTGEGKCIIAIQADNETCNFFRDRPYIMDYSKDSVCLYHRMLCDKYENITKLNKAYQSNYRSFDEILPPHGMKAEKRNELLMYFDWIEYKEYQILYALKKITEMIRQMELSIPIFHNCAYQNYSPISVQRDEQIEGLEVAGMDAYPEPEDTKMLKERIRYLAGSSRLPYVPEFGSGSWFDRSILLTPEQERFGYLYSFMNGLKAINYYMLVERDRWTGCPITEDGRIRENYYRIFRNLTKMFYQEKLHQYDRKPQVLVMKNYDMGRLKALMSYTDLNQMSSNCFILGPDLPEQLLSLEGDRILTDLPGQLVNDMMPLENYTTEKWIEGIAKKLQRMQIDFDYSDQYLPDERWTDYSVIVVSTYDIMDKEVQKRLIKYAETEQKQLIIGPRRPRFDRDFGSCTILADEVERLGDRIQFVEDTEQLPELNLKEAPEYFCDNANLEWTVHRSEDGKEQLLYVANVSGNREVGSVTGNRRYTFRRVSMSEENGISGEVIKGSRLELEIEPYTVEVWHVTC